MKELELQDRIHEFNSYQHRLVVINITGGKTCGLKGNCNITAKYYTMTHNDMKVDYDNVLFDESMEVPYLDLLKTLSNHFSKRLGLAEYSYGTLLLHLRYITETLVPENESVVITIQAEGNRFSKILYNDSYNDNAYLLHPSNQPTCDIKM